MSRRCVTSGTNCYAQQEVSTNAHGLWRILTLEQIEKKFAHLKRDDVERAGSSARHRVHHGMWTQIPVESLPELA